MSYQPTKMDIVGRGVIARYSRVSQAYAVTPFNPSWSQAVLDAAPVLRVISDREEAQEEILGPRSMRANGGLDWEDLDQWAAADDAPPPPGYEVEQELGEYAQSLSADRLLKPAVLKLIDPAIVYYFRRSRAWMLKVADRVAAEKVALRAHKGLVAKRSLTAADPFLHHLRLYVVYPSGNIAVDGIPERKRR